MISDKSPCNARVLLNTTALMQIHGYENSWYTVSTSRSTYNDDLNSNTTITHSEHGHNEFLRQAIPLGPPGQLNPGQYQFGFHLQLPDTLPPSFKYSFGGDQGEIIYILRAYVEKSGFDIKGEFPLLILNKLPTISPQPAGNYNESNISSCCCISKGRASIQISIDKDILLCGDTVGVTVQARNLTSAPFHSILLSLRRRFGLASNISLPGSINTQRYTETVCTASAQGLQPGECVEGASARCINLAVPPNTPPSILGMMIQCVYTLEAELRGGFGLSSLKVFVPVSVLNCPRGDMIARQENLLLQAPEGWNPSQVFPTVKVPVNYSVAGRDTRADVQDDKRSREGSNSDMYPPPLIDRD